MRQLGKFALILHFAVLVACSSQPTRDDVEAQYSIDDLRQRAHFAQEAGAHGEAMHNYSRILGKDPEDVEALLGLGETLLAIDQPERAEEHFARVLALQPKNIDAREGRAIAWLMQGNYADSRKSFNNLIEDGVDRWRVRNCLGIIADLFGDYQVAVTNYRRAIQLAPNRVMLQNNLGYSLIMNRSFSEAESVLDKALKSSPANKRMLNNLAMAIAWQGRYEEAIKRLRLVMGEAEATNNVGYVAYLSGDNEQAEQLFRRAMRLKPNFYQRAAENLELVLKKKKQNQ